jgi:hypothetical protein
VQISEVDSSLSSVAFFRVLWKVNSMFCTLKVIRTDASSVETAIVGEKGAAAGTVFRPEFFAVPEAGALVSVFCAAKKVQHNKGISTAA